MSDDALEIRVRALIDQLDTICRSRGWMIGFAESCTGGLVSSWLTEVPGTSKFYRGGVVSYDRVVKENVLGVPQTLIKTHGEVSVPVAKAMAEGARKTLQCTWAVSVTGVAGPSGGSPEKPVGTVCFGVAGPSLVTAARHVFPAGGGRKDIQRQAALFAFDFLVNAMI